MLVLLASQDGQNRLNWQGVWAENVSNDELTAIARDSCRQNRTKFVQLVQPPLEGVMDLLCERLHDKFDHAFLQACASAFTVGFGQGTGKRQGNDLNRENSQVKKLLEEDPDSEKFLRHLHQLANKLGKEVRR